MMQNFRSNAMDNFDGYVSATDKIDQMHAVIAHRKYRYTAQEMPLWHTENTVIAHMKYRYLAQVVPLFGTDNAVIEHRKIMLKNNVSY